MGGKTTQRVSGNTKPSSSGRIRDLMINNQQGVGNLITFSALSGQKLAVSTAKSPSTEDAPKQTPVSTQEVHEPDVGQSEEKQSTPSASTGKVTLVVRRVGNRDYFTRVKVPASQADIVTTEVDKKAHFRTESATKSTHIKDCTADEHSQDEPGNDLQSMPPHEETLSHAEETIDFDTILDQLCVVQAKRNTYNAETVDSMADEAITVELELMKLFKVMIRKFMCELSIEEWDLVFGSIYKWVGTILRTQNHCARLETTAFCVQVLEFIYQLMCMAKKLSDNPQEAPGDADEFHMRDSLLEDWRNFQASKVYQDLIQLYFNLTPKQTATPDEVQLLEALATIVIEVDPSQVLSSAKITCHLSSSIEFDQDIKMPKNTRYCEIDTDKFKSFLGICNLLKSNHRPVLVSAHSILSKYMVNIAASFDTSTCITDQDDIDELSLFPPAILTTLLMSRDSIMTTLLSDYRVGDISVTIEPNSDSYACTLSYLFVWDLVQQFVVAVDNKEVSHRIAHSLKHSGLVQRLLDNIFMLLPPLGERDALTFGIEDVCSKLNITKTWSLSDFLKTPLQTSVSRPISEIELIALHVYFSIALHFPITVRKWYNNNFNKRLCKLVNEYTVKHITEIICSLEMETVQEKCQERANEDKKQDNITIKARPSAKEVYAVYTRDEFKMELTIKLPLNYPLGPVQIDGGKRVGVTDVKWRSWLLQLTTFLSHLNGPLLEGIDLWKRNIDKKFEGIEKCMICFSILHSNYQLPKKKCQTCAKMFHNLCLYKWFSTSGNSTCPLCRNTW